MDVQGTYIRGYAFNQKRIAQIVSQVHENNILYVNNAEIEESNVELTWVSTVIQLKLTDTTQFYLAEEDPDFPTLQWNFSTIESIQEQENGDVIGTYYSCLKCNKYFLI